MLIFIAEPRMTTKRGRDSRGGGLLTSCVTTPTRARLEPSTASAPGFGGGTALGSGAEHGWTASRQAADRGRHGGAGCWRGGRGNHRLQQRRRRLPVRVDRVGERR